MQARVERDVTASGVRLRVFEQGTGPTVILLHGLFSNSTTWHAAADLLCEQFRVVALDFPGFGLSEKPPTSRFSYRIEAFSETIVDLYGALELGRAAVIGHALGGAVGIALSARHPELVSRLVLVDSLCYEPQGALYHRLLALPLLGGLAFKQLINRTAFRLLSARSLVAEGAGHIDSYYEAFDTPAGRGSALAALRAARDTRSVVADTSRVHAPTLVVWGRHDRLYPAGMGQRLAREIRGAGFELVDAGHAPQEERPDAFAAIVQRFLRSERPT